MEFRGQFSQWWRPEVDPQVSAAKLTELEVQSLDLSHQEERTSPGCPWSVLGEAGTVIMPLDIWGTAVTNPFPCPAILLGRQVLRHRWTRILSLRLAVLPVLTCGCCVTCRLSSYILHWTCILSLTLVMLPVLTYVCYVTCLLVHP